MTEREMIIAMLNRIGATYYTGTSGFRLLRALKGQCALILIATDKQ